MYIKFLFSTLLVIATGSFNSHDSRYFPGCKHRRPPLVSRASIAKAVVSVENFRSLPICDGILVANDVVLTAAHCVNGIDKNLSVRTKSRVLGFGGEVIQVRKNCPISGYNFVTKHNNIAILRLRAPVTDVIPAKLSTFDDIPDETTAVAYGWGFNTQGVLQAIPVTKVSEAICKAVYGETAITSSMICLSYYGGFDSCLDGAQGSPILFEGAVLAINARLGVGACTVHGPPGVFSKIQKNAIEKDIAHCV